MNKLSVAINGFGRIGRNVLRGFLEYQCDYPNVTIVAINDIADNETLLHLLNYDSTHGRLAAKGFVAALAADGSLEISTGRTTMRIAMLSESSPEALVWSGVDVVLECTGQFRAYAQAYRHIDAGAKQVIIGAAPFDRVDACVVMGVNSAILHRSLAIVSGVSCTTQALVPLLWLLDRHLGIKSAMLTEVHAVTADQMVLDGAHRDLRRARASGYNIIPTTSSSIAATLQVLPQLQDKLNGYSIRVPTINVAMIDLTLVLNNIGTLAGIKNLLRQSAATELQGIMAYTEEPLVSSDFIHDRHSLIVDGEKIMYDKKQLKVLAWYDNEWGYANRLLDMCQHLATF